MRQVREILGLTFSNKIPGREIARRLGIAASTIRATVERFRSSGLTWPLSDEITDEFLEDKLYGRAGTKRGQRRHTEPDWARTHRELKRKHVTLSILWEEYIEEDPDGYRYSRFCELYRSWEGRLSVTMRQSHVGGDKLFVDYAGDGGAISPIRSTSLGFSAPERSTCEMRVAELDQKGLMLLYFGSPVDYDVKTWTSTSVTAIREHPCGTASLTVDVQAQAVTIVSVPHADLAFCPKRRDRHLDFG